MRPRHLVLVGQHVTLVAPPWGTDHHEPPPLQDSLPRDDGFDDASGLPPGGAPRPDDRRAADDERARQLVARLAPGLLEGLQERRPSHQLAAWMAPEAHQVLLAWSRQRDWRTTRLVGIRGSRVARVAVEGVLLLDDAGRHFSAALRLEHAHGRWSVTDFDVLLPPAALRRAS